MAERRMMSKKITDTDAFLDMPLTTQALYFHFLQNADDDGFVGSPNSIMRKIGASKNDYDLLMVKRFIIVFNSGICVIKHWRIHNYIQKDRYVETTFLKEKAQLKTEENGAYTECIQNVYKLDAQYSIGKDSIGEDSIGKDREDTQRACAREESEKVSPSIQSVFNFWNEQNIIVHRELTAPLITAIKKAVAEYSESSVKEFIKRYKTVLDDRSYFFSYKWSLLDFLTRKSGIAAFTDEGSKWADYMAKREHKCLLDGTRIDEEDYPW